MRQMGVPLTKSRPMWLARRMVMAATPLRIG